VNGPGHYAEAQRLLTLADREGGSAATDWLLARAAVHATLAQTAALAEVFAAGRADPAAEQWRGVTR
jgi:hypothetical protein